MPVFKSVMPHICETFQKIGKVFDT